MFFVTACPSCSQKWSFELRTRIMREGRILYSHAVAKRKNAQLLKERQTRPVFFFFFFQRRINKFRSFHSRSETIPFLSRIYSDWPWPVPFYFWLVASLCVFIKKTSSLESETLITFWESLQLPLLKRRRRKGATNHMFYVMSRRAMQRSTYSDERKSSTGPPVEDVTHTQLAAIKPLYMHRNLKIKCKK